MPLFYLKCKKCNKIKPILENKFELISEEKLTCRCGEKLEHQSKGPSTTLLEHLDNGAMLKPVERYSDAEELFKKRHDEADPLAGQKNFS
jgi:hypothetical protein